MDSNTKLLIGIIVVEIIVIIVFVMLYVSAKSKIDATATKINEVDDEIEKELENNSEF